MENTLNSSSKNVWIIFLLICQTQADANDYSLPNLAKLHFTSGSTMGLYLAVVLPVDLPPTNAYEGFFFEAIYSLPTNETSFDYPPLVERGIDRNFIYDLVEKNIELIVIRA
ncbi:hypothetical protein JTB14_007277 [Gonioctena quinquepunctata]|nr:hypothetical protein JTB14_007277 [Gonioctena quinquepunctata]